MTGSLAGTRKDTMDNFSDYEITFILKEGDSLDGVKNILSEAGAQITEENDLGPRTLAYEIKKQTAGNFYRIVFKAAGESLKKIDAELRRQGCALRYLIVTAIRKPKESGKKRIPAAERVEKKEAGNVEEAKIQPAEGKEAEGEKKEVAEETTKSDKTKKSEPAKARPVKKAAEKKVVKKTRKATKAEASELDKKLEELVKED